MSHFYIVLPRVPGHLVHDLVTLKPKLLGRFNVVARHTLVSMAKAALCKPVKTGSDTSSGPDHAVNDVAICREEQEYG